MAERLGNGIKERRSELALTQAELAEKVGVTRKTINTVENAVFFPSALLALKLAKALNVPVEQLFWLEDPVPPTP
jgi:putative transcriptional regulator